jgi:hypothetical protein
MNLLAIVKVEEVGEPEPLCATAIAKDEKGAVEWLLHLADELAADWPDHVAANDAFGLAEKLSGDNTHYYVEAHEVEL